MLRMQWFKENYLDRWDGEEEIDVLDVLDVGSQTVSGQSTSYKTLFDSSTESVKFNYTGLDMAQGVNVDIVVKNPYVWKEISDNAYDVVISGQVFEHVEFPWFTIREMARVLKPGGLMCIIAPSMSMLHRYPVNCQNYFSDGLIALSKYAGLETLHASTNYAPEGAGVEWYDKLNQDSILVARKPADWKSGAFDIEKYTVEVADLEKMATGLIPIEQQKWYRGYVIGEKLKQVVKSLFGVYRAVFQRKTPL